MSLSGEGRSRARVVGYRLQVYQDPGDEDDTYESLSESPFEAVLGRAKRDGVVTEFDTGRGRTIWWEGRPGPEMRELRARIERMVEDGEGRAPIYDQGERRRCHLCKRTRKVASLRNAVSGAFIVAICKGGCRLPPDFEAKNARRAELIRKGARITRAERSELRRLETFVAAAVERKAPMGPVLEKAREMERLARRIDAKVRASRRGGRGR